MVNKLNKEILSKVDEIISFITKTEEYQKYLLLKDKLEHNERIITLIRKVKVLQKDVVHHLDKKNELNEILKELNNEPLYREYNNTLDEVNNYYNIVENRINKYFNDIMN